MLQLSVPLPYQWGEHWDTFFGQGNFLAKGANGSVYRTTMCGDPSNSPVAVKVIQKNTIFSLRKWHHIHREIDALRTCRHTHVIELIDVYQSPEALYVVLQYASGGDLFDWLVSRKRPSEAEVRPIAEQLLATLNFMHEDCGCVHRDIKPENVLLERRARNGPRSALGSEVPHIRLADFGFARVFPEVARRRSAPAASVQRQVTQQHLLSAQDVVVAATPCGTLGFAAPEILVAYSSRKQQIREEEEGTAAAQQRKSPPKGEMTPASSYGDLTTQPVSPTGSPMTPVELMKKMDIFAAGVTFCILLTGCEPFPCHSSKAHLDAVNEGPTFAGKQWAHVSNDAKNILRKMLDPVAARRPSAAECLRSRWMCNTASAQRLLMDAAIPEAAVSSGNSQSTPLLVNPNSRYDEDELAASYQKSVRSMRKNDGFMFVTDMKTGAVQRRQRPDVIEDTLLVDPPLAPPGPEFVKTPRREAGLTTNDISKVTTTVGANGGRRSNAPSQMTSGPLHRNVGAERSRPVTNHSMSINAVADEFEHCPSKTSGTPPFNSMRSDDDIDSYME